MQTYLKNYKLLLFLLPCYYLSYYLFNSYFIESDAFLASSFLILFIGYSYLFFRKKIIENNNFHIYQIFILIIIAIIHGALFNIYSNVLKLPLILTLLFSFISLYGSNLLIFFKFNVNWNHKLLIITIIAIISRLLYLNGPNLIPEEAYYWNYGQNLALGYLDHPPLLAWSIRLMNTIFGNSEFAIRSVPFLWWGIFCFYTYKFSESIFNKKAAIGALPIVAILPSFYIFGFFATPDTILFACWSGAIFYFHQAITKNQTRYWIYLGIFLGLGMLTKYTMAVLAFSLLTYCIIDKEARKQFLNPWAYVTIAISLVIFSPVIFWNMEHDWISFAFQTVSRLKEKNNFNLDNYLLYCLIQLGPIAIYLIFQALFKFVKQDKDILWPFNKRDKLQLVLSIVPFTIFLLVSINNTIRPSWSIVSWIVLLPWLGKSLNSKNNIIKHSWMILFIVLLLFYNSTLCYLTNGFFNTPFRTNSPKPHTWKEMGIKVSQLKDDLEKKYNLQLTIVGMDTYFTASELAFYVKPEHRRLTNTSKHGVCSWYLFKKNGLMYKYWCPKQRYKDSDILIISIKKSRIKHKSLKKYFNELTEIKKIYLYKFGKKAGRFYYRVGHNYKP